MSNLPKTKNEFPIAKEFQGKSKNGIKTISIRNSPVALNIYHYDDFSVEVIECKKVKIMRDWEDSEVLVFITNQTALGTSSHHIRLGFNEPKEAYSYYKSYLKRDFAYLVEFERVEK